MAAHGRSGRLTPLRRFVVADLSMTPTLTPGQGLIGVRGLPARVGQIRCAPHPERDIWVVKRVVKVSGDRMELGSDNPEDAIDSRHFGTVPIDGTYTVVLRVHPRLM